MRRIAWITALAIATTTSVALAQTNLDYDYHQRDQDRGWFTRHIPFQYDRDRDYTRDRDSTYDRDYRFDRRQWVPIAEAQSAGTTRQFINMKGRGGKFNKLRVEASRGAPVITKVVIEYLGDPNSQAVELNRRLAPGTGETIRLNGGDRRINRIIVYAEPTYRGSYSIYGA